MLSIVSLRDESIPAALAFSLWQPTQSRANRSWTAVAVSSPAGWPDAGTTEGDPVTGACGVAGVALGAAGRAGGGACAEETTTQLSPMVAAMMSLFIPPKRIPQLCEHRRSGFPAPKPYLTICRYSG